MTKIELIEKLNKTGLRNFFAIETLNFVQHPNIFGIYKNPELEEYKIYQTDKEGASIVRAEVSSLEQAYDILAHIADGMCNAIGDESHIENKPKIKKNIK